MDITGLAQMSFGLGRLVFQDMPFIGPLAFNLARLSHLKALGSASMCFYFWHNIVT